MPGWPPPDGGRTSGSVGQPLAAESGDRTDAFLGQGLIDGEGWVPHPEAGGGVALWVEVDDECVDAARPGARRSPSDRGLPDPALLIDAVTGIGQP